MTSPAIKLKTALLCVALITAQIATAAQSPRDTAENEHIIANAFQTWESGTYIFSEILAPDVRWTIHGSGPVAGTYTDMETFVSQAAAPLTIRLATPLVPEVHDIWAVGDTVIIRFDGSATTTSGALYENQFVWIFRMENGLVTDAEAFLDLVAYEVVVQNNEPRSN
ncbi:nuclear transport factor 2 family protein [uncultured Ruegeria sp.]|uniref:nuclear transport factor 2 family protein n=1 Tax=uncultured Ruegeria sp. TaxID=259304 RepID=UPI00260275FD|nr:nuclear transport factor 2 family protein [uncultured Ruegeria sp.]